MMCYQEDVDEEFSEELKTSSKAPWIDALLNQDDDSPQSSEDKSETFHELTMKGLLLAKAASLDLEPRLGLLSSKVRASTEQDWSKLVKIMSCALGTKDEVLTLSTKDSQNLYWHACTSFGACLDMRSHTGDKSSMSFRAMS